MPPPDGPRQIAVWIPPHLRPEGLAEAARQAKLKEAQDRIDNARLARAKTAEYNAERKAKTAELVVMEIRKYLRLAESPDFQNTVGPLPSAEIIKLAELVDKWERLDGGQATENVEIHHHTQGPDFSKLTQEERDAWRALAVKAGAEDQ